ncbi:unnamed protein product [Spirodela intermedia]|uniref:F-box domain-containing protein n=1 Tax=Spirodela intermedia TaxID=51605 RepID=A0A7I8JW75_SPIIN|nr:unnamed protein product [Spirodela intermedia]
MNCRNLPDEICTEILSWLPAKQVARCRSLCKGFRAVTRSQSFDLSQARRGKGDAGVFLRGYFGVSQLVFTEESSDVPPESVQFLSNEKKTIFGCDGGLVASSRLLLYNPARVASLPLGIPGGGKVLDNMSSGASAKASTWTCCFMECWLSSWERRWKLVSDKVFLAHRSIKIHHPVLSANGLIYLASTCGRHKRQIPPYLLAVDVRVGSSRILPLPEKAALASDDGDIEIAGSGSGSLLSLVVCNRASEFTIWDERGLHVSMASKGQKPTVCWSRSPIDEKLILHQPMLHSFIYSYVNALQPCERSKEG